MPEMSRVFRRVPNQPLQQTVAAMLIPKGSLSLSAAAPLSLVLRGPEERHETHVDDYRGERCAEKFHVVPIIVRPAGDIS